MKKLLALLSVCCLCLCLFPAAPAVQAAGGDSPTFVISTEKGYEGDEVTVTVSAVNNPGLFCLVWRDTGQYYFQNAAGSTGTYPVTAADAYTTWQCLSGFIIGTTNVPDLSSGQLSLVAYDAVCPNCFSESTIQRRLTFADEGTAHCTRCDRDYDLNNFGIVTQGGAGRSLFRYRVYYAADRLVVNN